MAAITTDARRSDAPSLVHERVWGNEAYEYHPRH